MRLLARREHAAGELASKLVQRGYEREAADAEIARLAREGLQSDERFTELFVEQRIARGDGPLKIRAALDERGIAGARIDAALEVYADEWPSLARDALAHRFGGDRPATRRERARRARFLQSRGFPASIVARVTGEEQGAED